MPMKLLVIVTNERGKVEEVFKEFLEIGVGGATAVSYTHLQRRGVVFCRRIGRSWIACLGARPFSYNGRKRGYWLDCVFFEPRLNPL